MIKSFLHNLTVFRHCQSGATLVEYGIAISLAIILGAGALTLLSGEIGVAIGAAGAAMPN